MESQLQESQSKLGAMEESLKKAAEEALALLAEKNWQEAEHLTAEAQLPKASVEQLRSELDSSRSTAPDRSAEWEQLQQEVQKLIAEVERVQASHAADAEASTVPLISALLDQTMVLVRRKPDDFIMRQLEALLRHSVANHPLKEAQAQALETEVQQLRSDATAEAQQLQQAEAMRPPWKNTLKMAIMLGPHQRLHILVFLPAREVARWANCSRASHSDTLGPVGELLWNSVYDSCCRLRGPASAHIRALVARPCGEAAVGCRVAVYSAEHDGYLCGCVQAFDLARNAYLILYDAPTGPLGESEVWETERRRDEAARMNPLLWSQNRFRFLTLPPEPASSSDAPEALAAPKSQLLQRGSWRDELRHTVLNTPRVNRMSICDATDEVLFVAFSPCGTQLASCSRDKVTRIYRLDSTGWPNLFAHLRHESTALRCHWWPEPPHNRITVSTGGPWERACAEVWDLDPVARVLQVLSVPFDIYAAAVRWPSQHGEWAILAGGGRDFLRGRVQEMKVYWPPAPGCSIHSGPLPPPLRLHLPLVTGQSSNNYCHCPEVAPPGKSAGLVAAQTGTGAIQCDAVVLFRLPLDVDKVPVMGEDGAPGILTVQQVRMHALPSRAVLSVRWARDGGLLLVNTRPRIGRIGSGALPAQAAPPLSTAIELLVLDPETLNILSVHGGHFAFTPSEAPFILHTDAWAGNDIVASGGEDHCVHIWHRRHRRQLQRLEGHTQAVNAVSWSATHGLLASASDDHKVILWARC